MSRSCSSPINPLRSTTNSILSLLALIAASNVAHAQTDEIQVYDGSLAERRVFTLVLHNNFIPIGIKTPAFPGGLAPDKTFSGVAEWAYGVTTWFEAGLYLPLYSISPAQGPKINGGKIRLLFAIPHADERQFFYGVNFELSHNAKHWDPKQHTSEIRPIIGWHWKPMDLIVNPILDTSYTGGLKSLDFAPAVRLAHNLSPHWTMSVEDYSDLGPLRQFYSTANQTHQLFGVVNHRGKNLEIEAGIGFGLTSASDRLTLKFMIMRDLNHPSANRNH